MSGFEVAGIALAVFPIVVDGIIRFVDGVQTIRRWRRYRKRLEDYALIMETQRVYYQDTLEELLNGIVSEDEIKDLIERPRGTIWKNPEYEDKLKQRLGRSHAVYLKTADKMVNALLSMCQNLGIDNSGQLLPELSSRVESEMKRLKVTLSKNVYKEILDMIDKSNKDLREFTHQNLRLEPIRQKRRSKCPLAQLKLIKKHAVSLYQILVTGRTWKCSCKSLHMASLRLESRPDAFEPVNADTQRVKFRILLTNRHEEGKSEGTSPWQEIDVIPEVDQRVFATISTGPQNPKRGVRFSPDLPVPKTADSSQESVIDHDCESIADMCSTLCANHVAGKAIGFLVDEEDDKHRHFLYRANTKTGSKPPLVPLSDYLGNSADSIPLSRRDRLQIAVTLASSVLQLHGTSWLEPQWSSKDIFFHNNKNRARNPGSWYPYMSWKVCMTHVHDGHAPRLSGSYVSESYMPRSEVLFALGLTLIELCFGKTLAEMHTLEDGDLTEATTQAKTAHRLYQRVYDELGNSYGNAVRRCLYQPFDVRDMSLDNEELQQKVFDDIVTPLNEDFLNFNGRSRIR